MATQMHNVIRNFGWRLEALTPTKTLASATTFSEIDPLRVDPSTIGYRKFSVRWMGSTSPDAPSDRYDRVAWHTVELNIYYNVGKDGKKWLDAQDLILQDRHDVIKCLRDTSTYRGYDADNTTTDLGLKARFHNGDTLEQGAEFWTMRLQWRCKVFEVEGT